MKLFFNISHPAHVHLFKYSIAELRRRGHKVRVASRKKEFLTDLLDDYKISHTVLTRKRSGFFGLFLELLLQQVQISRILKTFDADLMIQMNGIFNAPAGRLKSIPTIAFSDTENDRIANAISFSLTRHVFVPSCFDRKKGGDFKSMIRYPGYHELAYLSPRYVDDAEITHENIYLLRFVGYDAGHDIGKRGLDTEKKLELARLMASFGRVFVSSEAPLKGELSGYAALLKPSRMHDVMKRCRMVVGESATMTSEAACLGIPAVFIDDVGRGYTEEQEKVYGLVKRFKREEFKEAVDTIRSWAESDIKDEWQQKRHRMLKEKIDVTGFIVELICGYPKSIEEAKKGEFERFRFSCAR